MIRAARVDELERLRGIEYAAGEVFRSCGMGAIADDEPLTVTELALFQASWRCFGFCRRVGCSGGLSPA
ncbi:hypothetical protein [Arthrobacter sp. NA-172]|uniref:hypothetical protein n=1 Tax=Arthrobacter sp. NA-172 TaxID=3367524 RepID=UPI0037546685